MQVYLTSGKFKSQISIPLDHSDAARQQFVEEWLLLMATAVRLGVRI